MKPEKLFLICLAMLLAVTLMAQKNDSTMRIVRWGNEVIKPDTSKVLLLLCDTTQTEYYTLADKSILTWKTEINKNVYWINGFVVRDAWDGSAEYLTEDKKKLPKNYFVWISYKK